MSEVPLLALVTTNILLFFALPTCVGNVETPTVVTNNFRVIQLANVPNSQFLLVNRVLQGFLLQYLRGYANNK